MAGINSSLYPPLVETYMPAFIYTDVCRVYFSISRYNSIAEMHHPGTDINSVDAIQVAVQNQKTNQSMLKQELYPSGIKLATLGIDQERQGDDKYFIEIFPGDMENGFSLNEYYKVQIRLTSAAASAPPSTGVGIDGWLSSNLACFSEWSTVVLIRGISTPVLKLNDFENDAELTTFTLNDVSVAGKISFENEDSETLKSYRVYLYDANESLILDSGDIYVDSNLSSRQIKYYFNYQFESDAAIIYTLAIQIVTKNLYSWPEPKRFNFSVDKVNYTDFNASISNIVDSQGGRIGVHLESSNVVTTSLNIIIRRTSNKVNFKKWDDIYKFSATPYIPLNFTWYDYTVESGVWYKYSAETQNSIGYRSTPISLLNPIMIVPQDIFLTAEQEQLKIRFDPNISNFTHSISESKQDTIGSRYPFVRRNGSINYRTFSLSGTITHFMDIRQNLINASKQDLYQDSAELYETYNNANNINDFNDEIYEREFRKKVIDFLYKNNVKLFKSTTEGNMLVKLMDISFTPNTTLGRRIYSFNCTVVEVDEYNLDNLEKYNILDRGGFINSKNYSTENYGQIYRPVKDLYNKIYLNQDYSKRKFERFQDFGTSELVSNDITNKYQKMTSQNYVIVVDYLKYLKIEMTNPPYLIAFDNSGKPYKITDNTTLGSTAQLLGYIVMINGQYIIINKDGFYELTDSNTQVYSLKFVYPGQQGAITYEAVMYQVENMSQIPKSYSMFSRVGQFWGYFNINDSLYRKIVNRYRQEFTQGVEGVVSSLYRQNLQSIQGIRVQAEPGTVIYVRQRQDYDIQRHVINPTGLLEFYNEETIIQGLYFYGFHLDPALDPEAVRDDEFVDTEIVTDDLKKIIKPIRNGVYHLITQSGGGLGSINPLNTSNIMGPVTENTDLTDDQAQALNNIAMTAVSSSNQNGISLTPEASDWINNGAYVNSLNDDDAASLTDSFYQSVLTNYGNNTTKYIYFHGGWYGFDDNNDVSLVTAEGIIDYYCRILRRRY